MWSHFRNMFSKRALQPIKRRPVLRNRLSLEVLEDRTVPAKLADLVNPLAVSIVPDPSQTSSVARSTAQSTQALLKVDKFEAVSTHYVKVVFKRPADLSAADPATFTITDARGTRLKCTRSNSTEHAQLPF